jgi:pimeloyl-ACP methyl ester carboxylesterase
MSTATTLAAWRGFFGVSEQLAPSLTARIAARMFLTPRGPRRVDVLDPHVPFGEIGTLAMGDERIATYSWRLDSRRPRVLLSHGWEGWGLQWGPWIAPLLEAGYEVVTFDHVAHGRSTGRRATGPIFMRAIRHMSASFGPFDAIVGHSFGAAMAAMSLARGLDTRAIALVSSPSDLAQATSRFARMLRLSERTRLGVQQRLEEIVGVPLAEFSLHRAGGRVHTPALVVHDEEDREVPFESTDDYRQHWGGPLSIHATRGLGHRRIVRDEGVIRRTIEFLDAHLDPPA